MIDKNQANVGGHGKYEQEWRKWRKSARQLAKAKDGRAELGSKMREGERGREGRLVKTKRTGAGRHDLS